MLLNLLPVPLRPDPVSVRVGIVFGLNSSSAVGSFYSSRESRRARVPIIHYFTKHSHLPTLEKGRTGGRGLLPTKHA